MSIVFKDIADTSRALYQVKPKDPMNFPVPQGLELLDVKVNTKTGFVGAAFKKDDQILVNYRATDFNSIQDLLTDFRIAILGQKPAQLKDAMEFYQEVAQKHGKDKEIVVSGTSLGGALAQYVGANTGRTTITYNALGIAHLFKDKNPNDYKNIHNIIVNNDPIGHMRNQLGTKSYIEGPIININQHANKFLKTAQRILHSWGYANAHFMETVYHNPAAKPLLNTEVGHIKTSALWGLTNYHKNHPEVCGVWKTKPSKKTVNKPQVNINPVVAKMPV